MFIVVFSLVTLVFCLAYGDVSLLTKLVFVALYALSFLLLLIPEHGYLFVVAHCVLLAVVGGMTFGPDWLTQRR